MDNITFSDGRTLAACAADLDGYPAQAALADSSATGERLAGSAAARSTVPIQITTENAGLRTTASARFLHAGLSPRGSLHGTR